MRSSLALLSFSLLALTACSSFGSFGDTDVKKPPVDDPYKEASDQSLRSGTLGENNQSLAEFAASTAEIACGESTCRGGQACCVTSKGAACADSCDDGVSFSCTTATDCNAGQVCCLRNGRARCAASCDDEPVVCEGLDDCASGETCNIETCNGTFAFGVCRDATLPPRETVACGPDPASVTFGTPNDGQPPPVDPGPQP